MGPSLNIQSATPDNIVLAGYNLIFPERTKQEISGTVSLILDVEKLF
jgi:hypothetical protein